MVHFGVNIPILYPSKNDSQTKSLQKKDKSAAEQFPRHLTKKQDCPGKNPGLIFPGILP